MEIIKGDLLGITKGVIIHQVNNKGAMGAGLADGIKKKYPKHFKEYKSYYRAKQLVLGNLICTNINRKFGIIGMVSQDGWGRDKNVIYTNYDAFEKCLLKISVLYRKNPTVKYYMPVRIGCGLANGDWNIIKELIDAHCPFMTLVDYDN